MIRYFATILIFATASVMAGAQGPRVKPRADELAHLFERNRGMIEKLVDGSLKLSKSRDALGRSKAYGEVLTEMRGEIQKAADGKDSSRLGELAGHLGTVLNKGLVPNLESARRAIPAGSQDEKALLDVKDAAGAVVKSVLEALPETGDGSRKAIQEASKRVDAVK